MLQMNRLCSLCVRTSHLSSLQMAVIVLSVFISYQMIIHPLVEMVGEMYQRQQDEETTRSDDQYLKTILSRARRYMRSIASHLKGQPLKIWGRMKYWKLNFSLKKASKICF